MLLIVSGRGFIKIQYSSFPLFPMVYPFRIAMYYNITSNFHYIPKVQSKVLSSILGWPFKSIINLLDLLNLTGIIIVFQGWNLIGGFTSFAGDFYTEMG